MWKLLLLYCIWHEQTFPICTGVCKRHICKFLQQWWESSSVKGQSWWLREIGSSGTWQSSQTSFSKKMGEQVSQRIICWRNMAVVVAQWNWELKNLTTKSGKSLQWRWPAVQPNDSLLKRWQQFWLSEIGSSRTCQFNQASFCNVYWRRESSSAKGLYMLKKYGSGGSRTWQSNQASFCIWRAVLWWLGKIGSARTWQSEISFQMR